MSLRFTSLTILSLAGFVWLSGCQKHSGSATQAKQDTPTSPAAANANDNGASSGGGGFVVENSLAVLSGAKSDVVSQLRRASPVIFSRWPKPWTQQKFADVIENIRLHSQKDVSREGKDLMFNYGRDERGPYIEALRPFFMIYGGVPLQFQSAEENRKILLDVKLKLLHEASHLLGMGEDQAKAFSLDLLHSLNADFIFCKVSDAVVNQHLTPLNTAFNDVSPGVPGFSWLLVNGWLYHRALGEAFHHQPLLTKIPIGFKGALETLAQKLEQPSEVLSSNDLHEVFSTTRNSSMEKMVRSELVLTNLQFKSDPTQQQIPIQLNLEIEDQQTQSVIRSAAIEVPLMEIHAERTASAGDPPNGRMLQEKVTLPLTCKSFAKPLEVKHSM
jgi:hypothetical protein